MTHQVVLGDRAAKDLEDAYCWYAARWYNGVLDALQTLASHPERCPRAPESHEFPMEVRQLL